MFERRRSIQRLSHLPFLLVRIAFERTSDRLSFGSIDHD
jgi:hypothetical protein